MQVLPNASFLIKSHLFISTLCMHWLNNAHNCICTSNCLFVYFIMSTPQEDIISTQHFHKNIIVIIVIIALIQMKTLLWLNVNVFTKQLNLEWIILEFFMLHSMCGKQFCRRMVHVNLLTFTCNWILRKFKTNYISCPSYLILLWKSSK